MYEAFCHLVGDIKGDDRDDGYCDAAIDPQSVFVGLARRHSSNDVRPLCVYAVPFVTLPQ